MALVFLARLMILGEIVVASELGGSSAENSIQVAAGIIKGIYVYIYKCGKTRHVCVYIRNHSSEIRNKCSVMCG